MKVISIIQQKGGVGKTTLAVHLAHELKAQFPKLHVSVADADPQRSASNWIERGHKKGIKSVSVSSVATDGEGKLLKKEIDAIKCDVCIVDLPPAIASVSLRAALYSHLMLVPVGASALDMEAARAALDVCEEAISMKAGKQFLIVPTRIQSNTGAGKEIRAVLKKWGPVSKANMGMRVSYADAATAGEGVSSFAPGSEAHAEMRSLATEASKLLGLK